MRRFLDLYQALDATTRTNEKVDALVDYFTHVDARDAAWTAYLLAGGRRFNLSDVHEISA